MKEIDELDFIEEYVKVLPRPEIKFFDDHIESYIWEEYKKPNLLTGLKKVEVTVKINDMSYFVAEISYASQQCGEQKTKEKCLAAITSMFSE